MDYNRIDRIASAKTEFPDLSSSTLSSIDLSSQDSAQAKDIREGNFHNGNQSKAKDLGITNNIAESERFSVAKNKRSQGINQVANSLKLIDSKLKCDISVAMIANVTYSTKDDAGNVISVNPESKAESDRHLEIIQFLFSDFLQNIHEKL